MPQGSTAPVYEALGDSITEGLFNDPLQAHPALIASKFRLTLHNRAIAGKTQLQVLSEQIPSMTRNCALVTLDAGTNDVNAVYHKAETVADFQSALNRTIWAAHATCPAARIYVATLIGYGPSQYSDPVKNKLNTIIRGLPYSQSIHVAIVDVDADPLLHQAAYYHTDFVHPSATGDAEYFKLFNGPIAYKL